MQVLKDGEGKTPLNTMVYHIIIIIMETLM